MRMKRRLSRSIEPPVARINCNNLPRSTGLKRKNSTPAWNARAMTVRSSSPIIITITEVALVRDARICRASSMPFGGGMRTSRKMAQNLSVRRREAAAVLSVRATASIPAEEDLPNEFAGECIVVNDKDLCRHVIVPHVADLIPAEPRHYWEARNSAETQSDLATGDSIVLEAFQNRSVSRGRLCSQPAGSVPAPSLRHVPSRQSRGSRASPVFGAARQEGRGRCPYRD